MKRALITGVTGQDGAYLSQFLLDKGYEVYGLVRRGSGSDVMDAKLRWLHIANDIRFLDANLTDLSSIVRVMREVKPDEIYNLAAQSFVKSSWNQPLLTGAVTGLGAANMLEAIRLERPQARYYQASSSEMFGKSPDDMKNETTPFYPCSPYAIAKLYAHWMTVNYRESFGLHMSCGILFNHESPLRGIEFVTRRITDGVARIKLGLSKELTLGNLGAQRDWGHAKDYVAAMWMMLQSNSPDDFVIATGRTESVREFCRIAFDYVGLDAENYVVSTREHIRPAEVDRLLGDSSKARTKLGWRPTITLEEIIQEMVEADLKRVRNEVS